MELVEITKEEFKKIADIHPQVTFHQTYEWGDLKKCNGWDSYFVALKDNDKAKACALLLAKNVPIIKKKMFYSPRGFLIDYNDYDLLKEFTNKIKEFAKSKNAIFVKIDPYVEYQERDNDGNIVEGGYNNKQEIFRRNFFWKIFQRPN